MFSNINYIYSNILTAQTCFSEPPFLYNQAFKQLNNKSHIPYYLPNMLHSLIYILLVYSPDALKSKICTVLTFLLHILLLCNTEYHCIDMVL